MIEIRQKQVRDQDVDRLIPLIDVKRKLSVGWPMLVAVIRAGRLSVYDVTGRTVNRHEVTESTRALRVFESEVERFIFSIKVR